MAKIANDMMGMAMSTFFIVENHFDEGASCSLGRDDAMDVSVKDALGLSSAILLFVRWCCWYVNFFVRDFNSSPW